MRTCTAKTVRDGAEVTGWYCEGNALKDNEYKRHHRCFVLPKHPDIRESNTGVVRVNGLVEVDPTTVVMDDGWIEYNKTWSEFCVARLNKPGTQIRVQDFYSLNKEDVYLIGDINVLAGVCDDCEAFRDNQTVLRYRILITEEN